MEGKGIALLIAIIIGASIVGGMYYISHTFDETVRELYLIKNDKDGDGIEDTPPTTVTIPEWAVDYASELQLNGGMIVTKNGSIENINAGQKVTADETGLMIHHVNGLTRYYYEDIRMIRIG